MIPEATRIYLEIQELSEEAKAELFDALKDLYCWECYDSKPCNCWRDE